MRILDNMSLADQHVRIRRAEDIWQLWSEDGVLVAEAANTSKLSRYAMDRSGALKCTTEAWAGFHWRSDV
jgi:hypothetical protein